MIKQIYRFVFFSACSLIFVGCDSFLDDQPRGKSIAETTEQYNGMFNTSSLMNMAMSDYATWLNDDIRLTEDCVNRLSSMIISFKSESAIRAYRLERDVYEPSENCTAWSSCYQKIYTFNAIANGVMNSDGGTEAEKRELRAEARVGRAWMHFILAQIFCKPYDLNTLEELTIPIVKEAKASETNFKRATMKELYDFIVSEMEESCPELEDRTEHKMRVYKTTGYALLGKMYWMMGEYEKALPALKIAYERLQTDKAVYLRDFNVLEKKYGYDELSKRELFSEYSIGDYLLPVTYGNPEMLWVRQATNFMGVFRWYTGSVVYYLNPTTYDLFDEYDLRRNLIPTKNADGTPMVMPVGAIRDQTQNYGVEIPEVYLALAECEARVGDEANARKVLEEFRSYRVLTGHEGVPAEVTSRDELIRYCLDEEHREFFGRIQRVYNLRRLWNDPLFQSEKPIMHDDGTNQYTMTEDNLYIRIPDTVLDWNPGWEE